ncbi:Transferrin binding protein-like solute binding protein [Phocoenobacter uteri]|uniref:Transferrin binding protein-like solute binding protein n=1 Tax=Phocoenobacter uteri TaxID=146806 RepID=A0A379C7S3_9PAST|nr:transferrin-binding protein-like solute binding protein [Phocoenobacter uteri]MDG6882049.1 hypothetical protein [Phocoenobacter uteri]SUB58198.1 Transferrin binding protein-like solute binding protein [Phocoenobacter uteri]
MKKLVLVTAISLVLAACGSGGGSGSADNSYVKEGKLEGVLTSYDMYPDENGKLISKLEEITDVNPDGTTDTFTTEKEITRPVSGGKDLNHIMINGTNVQLLPDDYNKQENYEKRVKEYDEKITVTINPDKVEKEVIVEGERLSNVISGLQYKYMRFGIHDDYVPNPDDLSNDTVEDATFGKFVQGYVTTNMPQKGKITYLGDAYGYSYSPLRKGKSTIDVDFTNKTLKGTLSDWQNDDLLNNPLSKTMMFNAKIDGNQFEGKDVQGRFFGSNAAEVGGIYDSKERGESAVFGAKKQ